jgi:hypothetical protein
VLGVRHQPEDVSSLVHDGGDVGDGSVRVLAVAQDDLAVRLELGQQLVVGEASPGPGLRRSGS